MPKPFADTSEHLLAELERLDLLVRARVVQLRRLHSEDENFRGLYISEQEVDRLLAEPVGRPLWLTDMPDASADEVERALRPLRRTLDERRAASQARGIDLRLDRLAETFGLDRFESDVLLLCLAGEIDLRYERLYAYLQDDVTKRRPSIELALALLAPAGRDAMARRGSFQTDAPLRAHGLLQVFEDPQGANAPLIGRHLKVADRIVEFLFGFDGPDARLEGLASIVPADQKLADLPIDPLLLAGARNLAALVGGPNTTTEPPRPVVVIHGEAGSGRREFVAAICAEAGLALLAIDLAAVAPIAVAVSAVAESADREAALQRAGLYFYGLDSLSGEAQRAALAALFRALDQARALCFVGAEEAFDLTTAFPRRGGVTLMLAQPTGRQRAQVWRRNLAGRRHVAGAQQATSNFRLSPGRIAEAARMAGRLSGMRRGPDAAITGRDLLDACRLVSNQKLGLLARKVASSAEWNDLVLPPDRIAQLREICNQVKYRDQVYGDWGFGRKLALGKGLAVLFAGPSGTGKTMAAGVIASELGLDLYKIDLSTVISKYIGETEKNLSRIFAEAESSNAILFFDEADAVFGKRSEVRDSHDRYANVEVGYLLQRVEEYEGVVILATNLRKNLDDAFIRRLQFTIDFPFPSHVDRRRIWEGIWPADTPRDPGLDLDSLAHRYEMTGGNIRNIAVAAAFLAADAGEAVQMSHVEQATLREHQKTGKLIIDAGELAASRGARPRNGGNGH